jgi:Cu-Zn family superoxide dismutase
MQFNCTCISCHAHVIVFFHNIFYKHERGNMYSRNSKSWGGLAAHILYIATILILGIFVGSYWYYRMPWHTSVDKAIAVIYPTKGSKVEGDVTFVQKSDGMHVKIVCRNLTPGKHGCHIHEYGDGSCADGMCTGEHFNPTNAKHGSLVSPDRHVGDFGNLEADSTGVAQAEFVAKGLTLNGPHSIIGRAIIVHADPDDLVSQPSGNSGARVGCGIIGVAKPAQK